LARSLQNSRRRFRQAVRSCLVGSMFLIGILVTGLLFPACRLLAPRHAQRIADQVTLAWHRMLCRLLNIRITLTGQPMTTPGLLVANHISWLDILIIGAQSPVTFIAKSEVAGWPVLGYLAKHIGTLFVARGDTEQNREIVETMTWSLRQGKRLVLFPEGTTTTGDRVLRFHAKFYQPAALAGSPVQAIAVSYAGAARDCAPFIGDDDFLPHLIRLLAVRQIDVRLSYCQPLAASRLNRDDLAVKTRGQVEAALGLSVSDAGRAQGGR
jgi:1-acyl-sn-glycerol-3-phosphate acyltransferase